MVELFIDDNLLSFLATFPIIIVFSVFSVIVLKTYLRKKSGTILAFLAYNLSVVGTWTAWCSRAVFFAGDDSGAGVEMCWRVAYEFGALSLCFAMLFALKLVFPKQSAMQQHIVASCFGVMLTILVVIVDIEKTEYCGVGDFKPVLVYQIIFAILIGITLFIPNYTLSSFLLKAPKGSATHTKALFLEGGLFLYSISMLADGTKAFANEWSLFIFRSLVTVGGLLMLIGLRSGKKEQ